MNENGVIVKKEKRNESTPIWSQVQQPANPSADVGVQRLLGEGRFPEAMWWEYG